MREIIIDCDPGHDDAIALMLAAGAENLRILGVTTVAGNNVLSQTTANALKVLEYAGARQVPVYAGCAKPMMRALYRRGNESHHGDDGLGGVKLPQAKAEPQEMHAVDYIVKTLRESEKKITMVAIGPLTNIATALVLAPDIVKKIEQLVIMGGAAMAPGNITTAAEFNMFVDPEAASIVMNCGCRIDLVALDVSMKALFYEQDMEALLAADNDVSNLAYDLLKAYAVQYEEHYGVPACPVHDALCIAYLMDESLIAFREVYCDISLHDKLTVGETVCDLWNVTGRNPNINLSMRVDREKFVQIVTDGLKTPITKG